jgi:hypothetical protein
MMHFLGNVHLIFTVLVGRNFCVSNQTIFPAQPFSTFSMYIYEEYLNKVDFDGMCNLDGMHMEIWFFGGV